MFRIKANTYTETVLIDQCVFQKDWYSESLFHLLSFLFPSSPVKESFLAGSDVKPQRRRVVVLKEVQAQATLG